MNTTVIFDALRVDTLALLDALASQDAVTAQVSSGADVDVPEGTVRVWVRTRPEGFSDATLLERGDLLLTDRPAATLAEASALAALAARHPEIPALHTPEFRAAAALGVDARAALRGERGADPHTVLRVAMAALAHPLLASAEGRRPYAAGETAEMVRFYRGFLRTQPSVARAGEKVWARIDAGDELPLLDLALALEGGYAVVRESTGELGVRGFAPPDLAAAILRETTAEPVAPPAPEPVAPPAPEPVAPPAPEPVAVADDTLVWWMVPASWCTIAARNEAEARVLRAVHGNGDGGDTPELLVRLRPLTADERAAGMVEFELPAEFYEFLDLLRGLEPLDAQGTRFEDCMFDAHDATLDGTVKALLAGRAPRAGGRNAHLAGSLAHVDLVRPDLKIAHLFVPAVPLDLALPALEALGCRFQDTPR